MRNRKPGRLLRTPRKYADEHISLRKQADDVSSPSLRWFLRAQREKPPLCPPERMWALPSLLLDPRGAGATGQRPPLQTGCKATKAGGKNKSNTESTMGTQLLCDPQSREFQSLELEFLPVCRTHWTPQCSRSCHQMQTQVKFGSDTIDAMVL